jgi:cell division transport system permease protein
LFLIISILLMNNTIRLSIFSKRFIIKTMQLVGARPGAIRSPFLWSGIGLGIVSGLFAFAALVALIGLFQGAMGEFGLALNLRALLMLGGVLVGGGVLVAGGATWFSVNRFLRTQQDRLY